MDFILVAKENDTDQRIYVPPIPTDPQKLFSWNPQSEQNFWPNPPISRPFHPPLQVASYSRKLDSGKYFVYKCFWATLHCRSLQAGIIKQEWWVEAIFWKNPCFESVIRTNFLPKSVSIIFIGSTERSKFMPIETPEVHVAKYGGRLENLHLW